MLRYGWLPLLATVVLVGCSGEGKVENAGQAVGETLTDFASGVGKGIDERMEVAVELGESATALGLRKTVSQSLGLAPDGTRGISVYLISDRPVQATLLAKAMNAANQEVGRSTAEIDLAADDAKYVTFLFDKNLDTQLVEKYVVEVKKSGG